MMNNIDTSSEAVEQVAAWCEDGSHRIAASTLRALLAERDALRTDMETLQSINTELVNEHEAIRAEGYAAGQEDMRERAAQQCCERLQANIIRALPLPGDEP
jgi:outer membrane murein-binding lipoprotein Lpp